MLPTGFALDPTAIYDASLGDYFSNLGRNAILLSVGPCPSIQSYTPY